MQLMKCPNGHYYDADAYGSCPHCSKGTSSVEDNRTVAFSQAVDMTISGGVKDYDQATVAMSEGGAPLSFGASAERNAPNDDSRTISIFNESFGQKENSVQQAPVVGWLVCTKSDNGLMGRDFRLHAGHSFIGRDSGMDVCLSGETTVSRQKHASVIYEPNKNFFLVQPGDTKELTYLNGEVVLSPSIIKKNDIIQVGTVSLMLIPFCDSEFSWNREDKFAKN